MTENNLCQSIIEYKLNTGRVVQITVKELKKITCFKCSGLGFLHEYIDLPIMDLKPIGTCECFRCCGTGKHIPFEIYIDLTKEERVRWIEKVYGSAESKYNNSHTNIVEAEQ